MTHFSKKTLAIAITSLLAGNAYAVAVIYDGTGATDAGPGTTLSYASEIIIDDTDNKLLNAGSVATAGVLAAGLLDLQVDLGFGVATGQNYYPRLDLTNATFVQKPSMVWLESDTTDGCEGLATGTVDCDASASTTTDDDPGTYGEGGANSSYLIYSMKAVADRQVGNDIFFALNSGAGNTLAVTSKGDVKVKYRLYQAPAGASQETATAQLGPAREFTLLNFTTSSVDFSPTINADIPKIDVAASSKKFAGGATVVQLGKLTHEETEARLRSGLKAVDASVPETDANSLINVAAAGTKLVVTGDFAAAVGSSKKVWLDGGAACDTAIPKTATVTATEATWTIDNETLGEYYGNAAGSDVYVCMQVDGVTEINGGEYIAKWLPVSASTYNAESKTANLSTLERNGTVMQSPFFTVVPGYVPRFYLTNTGTADATFTINLISDAAATAPLVAKMTSGTIPKGGALLIKGDELVESGQRGAAIFQVNGEPNNINGVFNFRNSTSGDFDSYTMVKKK